MIAIGYALIVIATIWFLYKLYVSYTSAGGTDFQMPVYDAAMYPPIMGAVGLYLVLRVYEVEWPVWAFFAIWIGLTAVFVGAIRGMEELGDRPLD